MERVSSSVVRQLGTNMKNMEVLKEALGDNVHLEGKWWLGGEPWIDGAVCCVMMLLFLGCLLTIPFQINLLQGNVDVSFKIRGTKGVYTFTTHMDIITDVFSRRRDCLFHKHPGREGQTVYHTCVPSFSPYIITNSSLVRHKIICDNGEILQLKEMKS